MQTYNNNDDDNINSGNKPFGNGDNFIPRPHHSDGGGFTKFVTVLVLLFVLFGAGYWFSSSNETLEEVSKTDSSNPTSDSVSSSIPTAGSTSDIEIINKLNDLENKKDYLALIRELYENVNPETSPEILSWLKEREDSGFAPYLYATARHLLITNEPYQALLYYSAAGLIARVDAAHCTDRTAAGMVAFLENGFSGVHKYMADNPGSKRAAGTWAMLKEETSKNRPLPEWLCLNGDSPSPYVPFLAQELWENERTNIRVAFDQFMQQPTALTETENPEEKDAAPASGQ